MRTRHLYLLKVDPCNIFADYGEKNSSFMIEKSNRHHLRQVNKILITSNQVHSHYVPCLCEAMRRACPFFHIPAPNVLSESNREPWINTNLATFYQTADQRSLSVQIMKDKDRGTVTDQRSRRLDNSMQNGILDWTLLQKRDVSEKIGEIRVKSLVWLIVLCQG